MDKLCRNIAVIGAGPVGLLFTKIFQSAGHKVRCFEKAAKVGGIWRMDHHTHLRKGFENLNCDGSSDSTYNSVHLNGSKFTQCDSYDLLYEDIRSQAFRFLSREQYLKWIENSAQRFNLISRIRFNSEIVRLDKLVDGWNVTYSDHTGENQLEKFDFVVSCTGNRYAKFPTNISDMDKFKGISIHSSQVRYENELFPEKNVLIIGASHSGLEMAYWALKNNAQKVHVSLNKNSAKIDNWWLVDRMSKEENPSPVALAFNRYFVYDRPDLIKDMMKRHLIPFYKLSPDAMPKVPGDIIAPADSEYMLKQLEAGRAVVVDAVDGMKRNGARCTDGSVIDDVDVVVYCTGFVHRFPWISHLYPKQDQEKNELYYHMLPIDDQLQGLALPSFFQGMSSFFTAWEIQARWLCKFWLTRNYDNNGKIYSSEETERMRNAIAGFKASRPAWMNFFYVPGYYALNDTMAHEMRCLPPDYRELLGTGNRGDVELGIALMHSPLAIPMQYRLDGDDSFDVAPAFVIELSKYLIGDDKFKLMVNEALENLNGFYEKYDIGREKFIPKHYMEPFFNR